MSRTDREQVRSRALERCRERGIVLPTFAQMRDPTRVDETLVGALRGVDMQAVDPLNLFRIGWHNDVDTGGYGAVNALEIPASLSGVPARIFGLLGARFPTGAHKVGAAYGCLAPRLVGGEFDPTVHTAVWPSTGNYCRGGVFDGALLGCHSLAILPEEMSQERFDWLESLGCEVVATPGGESNVKEIFDACHEVRRTRPDAVVFNQFEEFGNALWHRGVTGPAVEQLWRERAPGSRLAGWVSASGSSGTLSAGDHLKHVQPGCRIVAVEALQCPTLLRGGYGDHRIEGIGDKHVPWIHNVRNTDIVVAIDDEATMRLLRLFNEPAGHDELVRQGVPAEVVAQLPLLGISSACNLLAAIQTARQQELDEGDALFTSFTDPASLYLSRLEQLRDERGEYTAAQAASDFEHVLLGAGSDHMLELRHDDRRRIHNLKYFTWVEQQGRTVEELEALWSPSFWSDLADRLEDWDARIEAFNRDSGALDVARARHA